MAEADPPNRIEVDKEKIKKMETFPRSDDFAVLLGFRNSRKGLPPARTEQHKVDIMNLLYIPRLLLEDPLQQDVVFSRFCAMYFPELVEHYLDPPEPSNAAEWNKSVALEDMKLANAYGYLLVHLNGNPYFDRFFRLPKHREIRLKMINALLDRLYERAPAWEQREAARDKPTGGIAVSSLIYDYCQLLSAIMLFESEDVIANLARSSKVQTLLNFLDWWEQRYNPKNASKFGNMPKSEEAKYIEAEESTSRRSQLWPPGTLALIIRNGSTEKEREGVRQARHLKSSLHTCGLPGCNRGFAKDGGSLLQCSQCSTVRYCCSEHQTLAWKHPKTMHKEMCHMPVY